MTHADLVAVAGRWLTGKGGCKIVAKDLWTYHAERPDAIGWSYLGVSTLIECKVTRNDFHADKLKSFRQKPETGLGVHRYYMVPRGLVAASEVPEAWGLLEVHGGRVFVTKKAGRFRDLDRQGELFLFVSIARRLAGVYEGEAAVAPLIAK